MIMRESIPPALQTYHGKLWTLLYRRIQTENIRRIAVALSNVKKAMFCDAQCGPTFGSDLRVADDCNISLERWTKLGATDLNDTGFDGALVLTGEKSFAVKEIEVFSISL
jgi:hypothetical protein